MSNFDWLPFLRRWNDEVFASAEDIPRDAAESIWLGSPGATEVQIAQAESRLGKSLPSSYRSFLKVTNGWHLRSSSWYKILPIEEVELFRVRNQDWIDIYTEELSGNLPPIDDEDYFVYGDRQDTATMRVEYLEHCIEISQDDDLSIYLLNPQVMVDGVEWEAWFFASWIAGAVRYRSFEEMMQEAYGSFLQSQAM